MYTYMCTWTLPLQEGVHVHMCNLKGKQKSYMYMYSHMHAHSLYPETWLEEERKSPAHASYTHMHVHPTWCTFNPTANQQL